MKKQLSRILSVALTLMLLFPLLFQHAEAAGISLSGDGSLRPGDSVSLTFSAGGTNIYALQASLEYDSTKLTLLGSSCQLGSSWTMDMHGRNIVLSDSQLNDPINASCDVFSVTFQVKDSVSSGETVSASVSNVTVSDGENDTYLGSTSWSADVSTPLSSDAALSSLSVSNATLSPAFSADTTSYTTTVPYDVESLDLSCQASDSNASVSVSGNELSVGSNTITIQVTAQDGSTRRYTIAVTREEDPNYVLSKDATLSRLKPSIGRLSPAFSPDITSYVVYVPYEVTKIKLTGTANDGKAQGVSNISSKKLEEGDNLLRVSCTAEDGTVQDYEVHVIRMPQYAGVLPEIISPDAVKPGPVAAAWSALCAAVTVPFLSLYTGDLPLYIPAGAALLVLLLLVYLLGRIIGKHAGRKKALRHAAAAPASQPETPTESEVDSIPLDTLLDDIKNME